MKRKSSLFAVILLFCARPAMAMSLDDFEDEQGLPSFFNEPIKILGGENQSSDTLFPAIEKHTAESPLPTLKNYNPYEKPNDPLLDEFNEKPIPWGQKDEEKEALRLFLKMQKIKASKSPKQSPLNRPPKRKREGDDSSQKRKKRKLCFEKILSYKRTIDSCNKEIEKMGTYLGGEPSYYDPFAEVTIPKQLHTYLNKDLSEKEEKEINENLQQTLSLLEEKHGSLESLKDIEKEYQDYNNLVLTNIKIND